VGNQNTATVQEIDRELGTTVLTIHGVAPGGLAAVGAATDDTVWASDPTRGLVVRIDAQLGHIVRRVHVADRPTRVAADRQSVWVVTSGERHELLRIDPATGRTVARIPLPIKPKRVALGSGSVWVTGYRWSNGLNAARGGALLRIDPATDRIAAKFPLGDVAADGVVVARGLVWVAVAPSG
jgi:hypothetical protein